MSDHPISSSAESDEEYDWEEVEVPEVQPQALEIILNPQPKTEETKKKPGISHAERRLLIDCHKIHTVALLATARIRNEWLNDELLHARLLSICPMKLQSAFAMIHKSRIPDPNQRGRMFESAIRDLTEWWSGSFEILPEGHLRNRTFRAVQKIVERYRVLSNEDDSIQSEMDLETLQDALGEECEIIRSSKSLMKHLLMAKGTRDTSAQLFTALCRALGIPARLVVSLQSVPWQASVGRPKAKYTKREPLGKGKDKEKVLSEDNTSQASEFEESAEDQDMEAEGVTSRSSSAHSFKGKGKAAIFPGSGQRLDGSSSVNKGKGKGKEKPPIKLRKSRPQGRILGSAPPSKSDAGYLIPDPTNTPPVYWTEVFSKPDGRWLPVDPIRSIVNKRKVFDPSPIFTNPNANTTNAAVAQFSRFNSPAPNKIIYRGIWNQDNRLLYVLAFEEDGYARDVTRRYALEYGAKVAKMQGGSGAANMGGGGKGRLIWWNHVLSLVQRPYRLHRDDIEDNELETAQMLEGMPTTIGGFKDHPVYVLTRHLKQNETIYPPPPSTPELGKFRGEPVYPRTAVVSLKSAENWMRSEGRTIKTGEQPLKMVKVRAGTVNKLRELEVLNTAGTSGNGSPAGDAMQGMYGRSQTEPYVPDPVIDGIVPKNNFGNIDLYTPSMLPRGAAHIPYKGVAKIAKKLGFDFAEAVTGFEFKKQRAFPVIEGVVVAKENEGTLLEAFWESERVAEEKARLKREERVIKQWTRLIQGLRIRKRLQEQYGTKSDRAHANEVNHKDKGKKEQNRDVDGSQDEGDPKTEAGKYGQLQVDAERETLGDSSGGYHYIGADDVVEAFHLPKFKYVPDQTGLPPTAANSSSNNLNMMASVKKMELEEDSASDEPDFTTYDLDEEELTLHNLDIAEVTINGVQDASVPKTMAELADDAAVRQQEQQGASPRSSRSSSIGHRLRPRLRQPEQRGDENVHAIPDGSGKNEFASASDLQTKKIDVDASQQSSNHMIEASSEIVITTPNANGSTRRNKSKKPPRTPAGSTYQRRRSTRTALGRKRTRKDQSDVEDSESSAGADDGDADVYNGAKRASKHSVKPRKKTRRETNPSATQFVNDPPISVTSAGERHGTNVSVSTRTLRPRTSKISYQD